jgi:hypothetical protein
MNGIPINVWLNLDGDKVQFFRSSQENMNFSFKYNIKLIIIGLKKVKPLQIWLDFKNMILKLLGKTQKINYLPTIVKSDDVVLTAV